MIKGMYRRCKHNGKIYTIDTHSGIVFCDEAGEFLPQSLLKPIDVEYLEGFDTILSKRSKYEVDLNLVLGDCRGVDFNNVGIEGLTFDETLLTHNSFGSSHILDCRFKKIDFYEVDFGSTTFSSSEIENSTFDNVLIGAGLSNNLVKKCTFKYCTFFNFRFESFENCTFENCTFENCTIPKEIVPHLKGDNRFLKTVNVDLEYCRRK